MEEHKNTRDIAERTFDCALRIIDLTHQLPDDQSGGVIKRQLVRCGTSIGANVEEAAAAYSRSDFIYRMNVALKEARETHYWLRLVVAAGLIHSDRTDTVISEVDEIRKILGAIVSKARSNSRRPV